IRNATPEQLKQLEDSVREMAHGRGAGEGAELDLRFHELLVRFAGHERLLACWQTLYSQLKLLVAHHNLRDPQLFAGAIANHRRLIALIKARDESGAVAHVEESGKVYCLETAAD